MRRFLAGLGGLFRRRWRVLVLLGLLGMVGLLAGPPLWAWRHLAAGRAAVEHFRADEARAHLDAYLAVWPDNVEARLLDARAARLAGDYEAAERQLRECQRRQKSPSEETVLEWAMYHAASGDLDDVESYLLDFIRKDPERAAPIRQALAEGYTRAYRVVDALNCLQQWLDARPDDLEALAMRGDLYWQIGALAKSADDYRRVVDLDGGRRQARERLTVGLIESGRFEEALKQLEMVREWKPHDPSVETRVARCYEWLNRPEEAQKTLDAVLARDPDFGPALRQQGHLLLQAGRPSEAEDWLRRAVRAMPADYAASWSLYDALQKEGKADEAQTQLARAEELKDRNERFTELTTRQMNIRPRDPALHCEIGELFLKRDMKDLGERWLLSALNLDPHYRQAHADLAEFYRQQGDAEKAALHRREAQEESSSSPPAQGP